MTPLLYTIPANLVQGVQSGTVQLTGAILKDTVTGQILGHVQQTGALDLALSSAMKGAQSAISGGFNPLGVITAVQNQQIKSQIFNLQNSLGLLQNLQVGSLAVSGLGLGVSVIGFAVMLKRLKRIENHLGILEQKIDQVTLDRRSDYLHKLFANISTYLEAIDTLSLRKNKVLTAETSQQGLAQAAGELEVHFTQNITAIEKTRASEEKLDILWSIGSAIGLCHEAGLRAMFMIDELEAAKAIAMHKAHKLLQLSSSFTPDSLARLCIPENSDLTLALDARRKALPSATTLVDGFRQSVATVGSQADLAAILIEKGVSGSDYLDAATNEKDKPLLYLPA